MRGQGGGQERQQPRLILGDDAEPLPVVGVEGRTRTPLDGHGAVAPGLHRPEVRAYFLVEMT